MPDIICFSWEGVWSRLTVQIRVSVPVWPRDKRWHSSTFFFGFLAQSQPLRFEYIFWSRVCFQRQTLYYLVCLIFTACGGQDRHESSKWEQHTTDCAPGSICWLRPRLWILCVLPGHLTVSPCYKLSLLSRWQDEKRPELHSAAQRLIIHDLPLNMYASVTSLHMWGGFKYLYGPETVHVTDRVKVIVFFCFLP